MAPPPNVRIEGLNGAQIYGWLAEGAGTSSINETSAGWKDLSTAYGDVRSSIEAVLNKVAAVWEGAGADSAQHAISPLGEWADSASQCTNVASTSVLQQGDSFGRAANSVQKMEHVPDAPWGNSVTPWSSDYDDAISRNDERTAVNRSVLSSYGGATDTHVTSLPAFVPPKSVGTDLLPTPVPPSPPPGSDGGGGGNPWSGSDSGGGRDSRWVSGSADGGSGTSADSGYPGGPGNRGQAVYSATAGGAGHPVGAAQAASYGPEAIGNPGAAAQSPGTLSTHASVEHQPGAHAPGASGQSGRSPETRGGDGAGMGNAAPSPAAVGSHSDGYAPPDGYAPGVHSAGYVPPAGPESAGYGGIGGYGASDGGDYRAGGGYAASSGGAGTGGGYGGNSIGYGPGAASAGGASFGPGSSGTAEYGSGAGASGTGSGPGRMSPGGQSGTGANAGAAEQAMRGGVGPSGTGGGARGGGMGGMGGGMGGGRGKAEDEEHYTPEFLKTVDAFGHVQFVSPPVIGAEPPRE